MTTHLCIHGDVFTRTQRIVDWIATRTGWPIMTHHDLIEAAGRRFNIPTGRLERAMNSPDGMLNRLTNGTERSAAYLQSVLAEALEGETTIFHGTMALLCPRSLPQVMNVLVTAEPGFRVQRALHTTPANERQIKKVIHRRDRREFQWCRHLFGSDRFDADAYDLVVPSDKLDRESAGRFILERMVRADLAARADAPDRLADFKLAANIQVMLCESGHPVSVAAEKGRVRITVERPVLWLNRLARKMEQRVSSIEGVSQVAVRPGSGFFQADIYRRSRFETPTEMAFRSFVQCRRELHDHAAHQHPEQRVTQPLRDRVQPVHQLGSIASP